MYILVWYTHLVLVTILKLFHFSYKHPSFFSKITASIFSFLFYPSCETPACPLVSRVLQQPRLMMFHAAGPNPFATLKYSLCISITLACTLSPSSLSSSAWVTNHDPPRWHVTELTVHSSSTHNSSLDGPTCETFSLFTPSSPISTCWSVFNFYPSNCFQSSISSKGFPNWLEGK